jgi:hypothetical protein
MKPARPPQSRQITDLRPAEFENLVFDLVYLRGAKNIRWRTPGPDGGRDIEALVSSTDFSGHVSSARWYIECKRYQASVDWPTIYEKLAYADAQQADVLLMCTTSTFSPNAISEVDRWNSSSRRNTHIRLWPYNELYSQLSAHPDLQLKYGIATEWTTPGRSLIDLALALSKSVSSHYSREVFREQNIDRMLFAAQSLSELLQRRMEDLSAFRRVHPVYFRTLAEAIERTVIDDGFVAVDGFAIKAFVAYLAALSQPESKVRRIGEAELLIECNSDINDIMYRYQNVFASIAVWGDIEFELRPQAISIIGRSAHE